MSKTLQTPAQVTGYNQKADRSLSVRFNTSKEYSPEEIKEIATIFQTEGWLLFKQNDSFEANEVPKENAPVEGKKPSQRLRSIIFVLWKESKNTEDFELFYRRSIEALIELYKQKIDNLN